MMMSLLNSLKTRQKHIENAILNRINCHALYNSRILAVCCYKLGYQASYWERSKLYIDPVNNIKYYVFDV